MSWNPLEDIELLPLLLAGPILRRTERDAVTVWLALKAANPVTLRVYSTDDGKGLIIRQQVLEGTQITVQLGQYLHIVAVTAKPVNNYSLQPGHIYAYDLDFGNGERNLTQALNSEGFPYTTVSYFEHSLPTFAMSPDDLNNLKIVHGSCRKPHGGDRDALPILDYLIEQSAHLPNTRPHQLFLTGDQIYGDDVADPLLSLAIPLGNMLLGWEENLPFERLVTQEYVYRKPSQLKPGKRSEIAEKYGGFTAMLHNKPEKAKSHLFSFGEYCAMYLFAFSGVLLSDRLSIDQKVTKNSYQWNKEAHVIQNFARELWRVRRAIANVATYMIFDDHDISDDWYLNHEWCNRVLGKPLGRRTVQNGLLAYAVFQAWGNTPEQFTNGQPGAKLLEAAQNWSASAGTDHLAETEIAQYLGIPPLEPKTGLPQLKQDEDVLILDRDYPNGTKALNWHYTVRNYKHEVIVLDTRTWRGYPQESTTYPPMLLSPTAFTEQIEKPLQQTNKSNIELTLLVLPTNLVHLSAIDKIQKLDLAKGEVFSHDVGDSWNLHSFAFNKLLTLLFQKRDRVIILSGDIHYSCAVRLNYWTNEKTSILVQLTSSAFKNAEWMTYFIHTKAKSLLPEKTETWAGWNLTPQRVELTNTLNSAKKLPIDSQNKLPFLQPINPPRGNWELAWKLAIKDTKSLPDWRYKVDWIKREKAQTISCGKRQIESNFSDTKRAAWLKSLINTILLLWRNRWLQEGKEVVGRNNFSVVSLQWSENDDEKAVIQDIYWHPPWNPTTLVSSRYFVPLQLEEPPPLPKVILP